MSKAAVEPMNSAVWDGKIRTFFRLITFLNFSANFALLSVLPEPEAAPFTARILVGQHLALLALLAAAETALRRRGIARNYIVIAVSVGYSAVIYFSNATHFAGLECVFVLPLLLSIVYFRFPVVFFASGLTLPLYGALIVLSPLHRELLAFGQKVLGFSIVIFCSAAAIAIVKRGLRIMENEKNYLIRENKHRIQKAAIDEQLRRDALTGLGNHRAFQERFRLALERTETESPEELHLALIDIDRFKRVNDTFGHWSGDIVLRRVGRLLGERASGNTFTARYGGEEFALLFGGRSTSDVMEELERIRAEVEVLPFPELDDRPVTVSIGCGKLEPGEDRDALFEKTDRALYLAKRGGRNRVAAAE